jgi:hypothetical protein
MKRLALLLALTVAALVLSATVVSAGGVAATLSCSDGFQTTYLTDATGLLGLQSSVNSVNTSPLANGYSCQATQTSTASSNPHDFAVGAGGESSQKQFEFSAHSDPGGANPHGHFNSHGTGSSYADADVYCLLVSGNQATMGIQITKVSSDNGALLGQFTLEFVQDNGHGNPLPDKVASTGFTQAKQSCVPGSATVPIDHGNITVHMGV